jgi:DNA-binding response OmpR family regulator
VNLSQKKRRILVVDDEEDMCFSVKEILETEKCYEIHISCDPVEAYQMAGVNDYDLVISDFNMPFLNGDVLFNRIEQQGLRTKLLLMSGLMKEDVLESKIQIVGGSDILIKPFGASELLEKVKKILAVV